MDISLLKYSRALRLFIGLLAGILTAVPYIGEVVFWVFIMPVCCYRNDVSHKNRTSGA